MGMEKAAVYLFSFRYLYRDLHLIDIFVSNTTEKLADTPTLATNSYLLNFRVRSSNEFWNSKKALFPPAKLGKYAKVIISTLGRSN